MVAGWESDSGEVRCEPAAKGLCTQVYDGNHGSAVVAVFPGFSAVVALLQQSCTGLGSSVTAVAPAYD